MGVAQRSKQILEERLNLRQASRCFELSSGVVEGLQHRSTNVVLHDLRYVLRSERREVIVPRALNSSLRVNRVDRNKIRCVWHSDLRYARVAVGMSPRGERDVLATDLVLGIKNEA